jgi:hypothetical protein
MRVQQLSNDTDPLVWCKQHQQETSEVPTLRPYGQAVPGCACERLFSSVGFVKSELRGNLMEITWIDVMWAKQTP